MSAIDGRDGHLDVGIVGAGPVGLSLALGLARAGVEVAVVEREAGTSEHSRAPAIWSRTQEILSDLGVLDRFLARGIVLRRLAVHDADGDGTVLELPLEELEDATPCPRLLVLPQSETERLLAEALRDESTARILFSTEATDLDQDESGVRIACRRDGRSRTIRASFVVGCDGADSTVREVLGARLEGSTYRTRAVLADVAPARDRDLPFPRISTRDGLAVAIRIDEGLWRLILPIAGADPAPPEARVREATSRLLGTDTYETVWKSEFRLHRRVSSSFVRGRIALAGDAAHLNSPVGGQGMNAGIQDAESLSRSLLHAIDRSDAGPLSAYETRRREAIEEGVNPFTDRLTRLLLFAGGRLVKPAFRLASLALRVPPLRRRFLRRIAMLE